MTNPLNLYATKVFAEHPTSMWALDEELGYISLGDASTQNFANWNVTGATVVDGSDSNVFSEVPLTKPFQEEYLNGLIEEEGNGGLISLQTINPLPDNKINTDLGSIAIGFYAFTYDRTVQARLGFSYINSENLEEYEVIRLVNIPANRSWAFVSETIALPENVSQIKPIIEFFYTETEFVYELAVNGISIGQWPEEFHTESLGVSVIDLPANIPIDSKAVEARAYGLQGKSGYYLASESQLYAKNAGVPLVFGSLNSTRLIPNENGKPSLIVPGEGMFSSAGQYKSITTEFWINVHSNAIVPRRIFGPIGSDDGIYVDKHLLKLKVGDGVDSHLIKDWGRPMLVGIRLRPSSASVLINGEQVMSLSLDSEKISYVDEFVGDDSMDWLGFYAYDDVPSMHIEAVAIYPYDVPAVVQKRRFVYGQGVEFPTSIQGLDNSTVASIDYSVANYDKNISYPLSNPWSSGYSENLEVSSDSVSLPSYNEPDVYFESKTYDEWISASTQSLDTADMTFGFRPNEDWNDENAYLYFKDLSFLRESLKAFYGVFETAQDNSSKQMLFQFKNDIANSFVSIYLQNATIYYTFTSPDTQGNLVEKIFHEASGNQVGDRFLVGISLPEAIEYFDPDISAFLQNLQNLKVYIGGTQELENTFVGEIIRVGFCGSRNLSKVSNFYNSSGIALDYSEGSLTEEATKETHIATYTLVGTKLISNFALDIAVDSYWEDYVPLSYFGTYVKDYAGNSFFDLDFIQFNIDYVKLSRFAEDKYDTSGLPLKTYVSFQYLASGANADPNYFINTEPLSKTSVINPGSEWLTTRYEILNDSAIKPPIGEAIDSLALVISMEFKSDGLKSDNLSISSIELSSQVLGQSPNPIFTKFGTPVIPFRKSGQYFEYKNVEPYTIHKRDTPYLYLTKTSGIRSRTDYSSLGRNGLSVPVNVNQSSFFRVNLFQMFAMYMEESFPIAPKQIFEIQSADSLIQFFLVADSNTQKRGQIYAIDQTTGRLRSGIVYYIDGKVVKRPIINLDSWTAIAISFDEPLRYDSFTGAFRVTSPLLFNHVSYYQTTQLDEVQRFAYRKWSAVRSGIDNPLDWSYWSGKDQTPEGQVYEVSDGFTWQEVLFLAEAEPTVPDASNIYKTYTGTASTILDSKSSLRLGNYQSSVLKDISWTSSTTTPV